MFKYIAFDSEISLYNSLINLWYSGANYFTARADHVVIS